MKEYDQTLSEYKQRNKIGWGNRFYLFKYKKKIESKI